MRGFIITLLLFTLCSSGSFSQANNYWHGKERQLRYTPEGGDFVIVNGDKKFNRALYGTNTAFRVETGDVPEFGFFMPNMGGNLQIGFVNDKQSLWLTNASYIKSIYRPGARIYEIKDPAMQSGRIVLTVLAMADAEGMVMKIETENVPEGSELICLFGGASNKRFFRNGDLGVDNPNAFSLTPDACEGNKYEITANLFSLTYGQNSKQHHRTMEGVFPKGSRLKLGSPYSVATPLQAWQSNEDKSKPVIVANISAGNSSEYYVVIKNEDDEKIADSSLKPVFDKAEQRRKEVAETVKINTPDPYFNTLGGVISTAADGIWDSSSESWQHGAIGWRMPLNGWRGAYAGDIMGWHDRARKHFDGYAASQIAHIEPVISHPSQDTELNLARAAKIWGTQMYSNGYICRNPRDTTKMHHYDMNLCYIDELLWHFNWTGDMDYVRKMWPVLKRHLEWEKRNFDPDGDGLYNAYACIWASDALQYNSGGVTHSSAYNYRANKMAAEIALKLGEDPAPYKAEAEKILKALNSQLWINNKGWWAEYVDFMGNKMLHPDAGVWTVYHAIDSDIHTPFQAYQATRYIDNEIPHIPVLGKGLEQDDFQTIATTNWLPYSWSVNNVAFAEVGHTSLAYWQAGRYDEAFKLFKSNILDGMYLGSSPGNIGQVSFYDAARGECYRDFADPVGVYSRVLVQGLFGVLPDRMNNRIEIRPGYPSDWNYASLSTPDIDIDFKRNGLVDSYTIGNRFGEPLSLDLIVKAQRDDVESVLVNGIKADFALLEAVDLPLLKISSQPADSYHVEIKWKGNRFEPSTYKNSASKGDKWLLNSTTEIVNVYDPQQFLSNLETGSKNIAGLVNGEIGHRTFFVQKKQGSMTWWEAIDVEVQEPFTIDYDNESEGLDFQIKNNTGRQSDVTIIVNGEVRGYSKHIILESGQISEIISVPDQYHRLGTNTVQIVENGKELFCTNLVNWNLKNQHPVYEKINIDKVLNASVTDIFKNEYLTPRSPYTTLQVPKQGIGEWCHPSLTAIIDDSGLRKAVKNDEFTTPLGVPFRSYGASSAHNIAFTSLWDNYPSDVSVPLSGKVSHAYLLMAGSTNHMQSHVTNAIATVNYKDGTKTSFELVNPETWVPIEQDFYLDGHAFSSNYPRPYRVALKTGLVSRNLEQDMNIQGVYGRSIDGGAGIILDIPLDAGRELEALHLEVMANEIVVGLMAVTLLK